MHENPVTEDLAVVASNHDSGELQDGHPALVLIQDIRAWLELQTHLGLSELMISSHEARYELQRRAVGARQASSSAAAVLARGRALETTHSRSIQPTSSAPVPPAAPVGAAQSWPARGGGQPMPPSISPMSKGEPAASDRFGPSRLDLGELGTLMGLGGGARLLGPMSPDPAPPSLTQADPDAAGAPSRSASGDAQRPQHTLPSRPDARLLPAGLNDGEAEPTDPRQADMFGTLTRPMPRIERPRDSGFRSPPPVDRGDALRQLRASIGDCRRCPLSRTRRTLLFGEGAPDAAVMFVLGPPSKSEEAAGTRLAGEGGELLARIVTATLECPVEEVFVTGAVLCAPQDGMEPASDELRACHPFLVRQVEIVRPRVIVAMGPYAARVLVPSREPLRKLQGFWFDFKGIPVRPTFHPESLLRDPSLKRPVFEDMQAVAKRRGETA